MLVTTKRIVDFYFHVCILERCHGCSLAEGFAVQQFFLSSGDVLDTQIAENEFDQVQDIMEVSESDENDILNQYYRSAILAYNCEKFLHKESLSDKEIGFIKSHGVISAVDVAYHLLGKYTSLDVDQQIDVYVSCLGYLAKCKIPKEYIGGFSILMIKYHFLP